jgi:murein DD-endopeptidase MepM/ murein hydrolase activator NlpD
MKKIFLSFLLLTTLPTLLSSKTYHWKKGVTFLSFLRSNAISERLYYDLDHEDKELLAEIRAGQPYTINGKKITIPITDELQIEIKNKKKISLQPIPSEILKGSIHLTIQSSFEKELYAKTHSKGLIKSLKKAYKTLNLKKLKKGDKLSIFYEQKRREGKAIGNPKILASHITINKKSYYNYRAEDGRYYDSLGTEYYKLTKSYSPYIRPITHTRISSRFTHRRYHPILHRYKAHLGTDYANRTGTPIKATARGKIIYRGWKGGYGRCIKIQHTNGLVSLYAHMSRYKKGLKVGSRVAQGRVIGYVGSSGRSTGPHLHFGMYKRGKAINPERLVRVKKHTTSIKKLKGKPYKALRKKVVYYRKKFKQIQKTGGDPLYIKKNNYLVKLSQENKNRDKKV